MYTKQLFLVVCMWLALVLFPKRDTIQTIFKREADNVKYNWS